MAVDHVTESSRDRSRNPRSIHPPGFNGLLIADLDPMHEVHRQHLFEHHHHPGRGLTSGEAIKWGVCVVTGVLNESTSLRELSESTECERYLNKLPAVMVAKACFAMAQEDRAFVLDDLWPKLRTDKEDMSNYGRRSLTWYS